MTTPILEIQRVITIWGIFGPVSYAILAGRATDNLIETDRYHKWSFRYYLTGTLSLLAVFLYQVNIEGLCK